ncbi:MAG: acyltransferase family protein [Firmicutes bacterium]|nr:acyltransferase family protein [Bacillota bacterium]
MNSGERNNNLDAIKGVCIMLVVFCHTVQYEILPELFNTIWSAVFLNCFFFVSGWLLFYKIEDNLKHLIKKKFISLAIPYVCFSLCAICWHTILSVFGGYTNISDTYTGWMLILRDLFCFVSGLGIGTLWFLPVLFITYLIARILCHSISSLTASKSIPLLIAVFCIFSILANLINVVNIVPVNFLSKLIAEYLNTLNRVCYGTGYTILGYLMHLVKMKYGDSTLKVVLICSLVLLVIFEIVGNSLLLEWAIVVSFVLLILLLPPKIVSFFHPLLWLGQNSLAVMIIHYIFLLPVNSMMLSCVGVDLGGVGSWNLFLLNFISTIITVFLLNKCKYFKYALGKGAR